MSKVQVTYSAPLVYLSSDQWSQIRATITSQFPLKDITWRSSSRPAARIISKLDVSFVNLDTVREEHASQIPQSLLDRPLLNIYVVSCEDTDVYKATVRRQIKDWLSIVNQRKNQEWLILLVIRPDNRTPAQGFFAIKGNVLERLRADFNTDKRDRCVQLTWSQGTVTTSACAELTSKMKEGIVSAFDSAVSQRLEDVRRSENQRQMPGWNFCTFFILKETLASTFTGMNLLDDAILAYSELEVSFLQSQTSSLSGHISWFGKLITPDPYDDSLPLLDITKKPYRDLILRNTITIFDFRVYLLAKHCDVLGRSGHVTEFAKKASNFLSAFSQRLKASNASLPPFFIESWVFSSALNVVSECDKWIASSNLDTAATSSVSAAKGELLELARIQLDKIGIHFGHLPNAVPFSMSLYNHGPESEPTTPTTPTDASEQKITNKMLLESMNNQAAFDNLYLDTINRAIELYVKGGRRKFALRLHGFLAALHLERERLKEASQVYSSLPAHYVPHSWTSLSMFMQARRLDVHDKLGNPRNREWVDIVLSFFKGFVEDQMHVDLAIIGKESLREYMDRLLQSVRQCVSEMEKGMIVNDNPMLSVMLQSEDASYTNDEDGSCIKVVVRNALPCDIAIDAIRLSFAGPNSDRLDFTAQDQVLVPGLTTLTLSTPNPTFGLFVLESSELTLSKLTLRWNYRFDVKQGRFAKKFNQHSSSLLRIPRDYGAVNVRIDDPKFGAFSVVKLDAPHTFLLTVFSGRNTIDTGIIKLPDSQKVRFLLKDAQRTEKDGEISLECFEDYIQFSGLKPESRLQLQIPYTDQATMDALRITTELQYWTSVNPSLARSAKFIRHLATALPLMIQAHDHFRGKSLISSYTISTSPGTYQHLRVSAVDLESVEDEQGGLVIMGCRSNNRILTVTPNQPAHCLFHVRSEQPRIANASLNLHIKYRLLREEIEDILNLHVLTALKKVAKPSYHAELVQNRLLKALEHDSKWVEIFNVTGQLLVDPKALPEEDKYQESLSAVTDMVIESLRENQLKPYEEFWKEVVIPVDLPFKNVIAATDIHVHSKLDSRGLLCPLYAGQPVSATVSISSSCHWVGPTGQSSDKYRYTIKFDIQEMVDDWLISGHKRGEFIATDGSTYSISLTLIPLHHGELALPQVNITPLPVGDSGGGAGAMSSKILPSVEVYQKHGAERIIVLPPGGPTTFVVDLGE
ncbi:hypothetical protein Clacol_009672 [Clathrus columnatus]|uniref:Trafficking protein particle complex subunit 10 n=1 Tax=Clathrus columnatus TaxID=1419009 RepID=A0AAV5ASS8_9AGAM|nr:hypothetical protein Clacol_009672 [Clathrus columnatus]